MQMGISALLGGNDKKDKKDNFFLKSETTMIGGDNHTY